MLSRMTTSTRGATLGLLLGLAGCGGEGELAEPGEPALLAAVERSSDPRMRDLWEAIDRGRHDRVDVLLPQVRSIPGVEVALARARVELMKGDAVGALALVEELCRTHAADPRPHATRVEVYASLGRLQSAEEALAEALERFGPAPELLRAQGVLYLVQPGGGGIGLQYLELARAGSADLPYLGRVLFEAQRLVARQALADGDPERAETHLSEALEWDPRDEDTRLLLCDALAARGDFEQAVVEREALFEEFGTGQGEVALLLKRAATAALLETRREAAVEHFLRARELGLTEEELGFGATALADAFDERLDRGVEHYRAGAFEPALRQFTSALEIYPESSEALHMSGLAAFRLEFFEDAARLFEALWLRVLDAGEEFEVPVHLDLARALRMLDQVERARQILGEQAARFPGSAFGDETREMLERL